MIVRLNNNTKVATGQLNNKLNVITKLCKALQSWRKIISKKPKSLMVYNPTELAVGLFLLHTFFVRQQTERPSSLTFLRIWCTTNRYGPRFRTNHCWALCSFDLSLPLPSSYYVLSLLRVSHFHSVWPYYPSPSIQRDLMSCFHKTYPAALQTWKNLLILGAICVLKTNKRMKWV